MNTIPLDHQFSEIFAFLGPRFVFAVLCGGIVGLERELKNKVAGLKTNMLICVGAAFYTSLSLLITANMNPAAPSGDPGRIAAQIVSGIGFLGGGAIIQARGTIFGLTTAATIWVVASIGILVGLGFYSISLLLSFMIVVILTAVTYFEEKYLFSKNNHSCEIVIEDDTLKMRKMINTALERNELTLDDFTIDKKGGIQTIRVRYKGFSSSHKKFVLDLWSVGGVREVRPSLGKTK